jgi:hypothetical protein
MLGREYGVAATGLASKRILLYHEILESKKNHGLGELPKRSNVVF